MKKSKEKSNRFDYLNIKTIEGKKKRKEKNNRLGEIFIARRIKG